MTPEKEAELFVKLDLLMTMARDIQAEQRRQAEALGELKGHLTDMPTARDFGRLEGRLEEMSARLPTVIGYSPPPRSAAE